MRGTCEIVGGATPFPRTHASRRRHEDLLADPTSLIELFHCVREENSPSSRPIAQAHGPALRAANIRPTRPPRRPRSIVHDLPFRREWHSDHTALGGIGRARAVRWSVNTHRRMHGRLFVLLDHVPSRTFRSNRAAKSR